MEEAPTGADTGTLDQFFGYAMKRAYMLFQPSAQAALSPLDLRLPTFSCLAVIVANPGIAPSRMAKAIGMERPNSVAIVDELERAGLVERTQSSSDRRRYALRATGRGRHRHDQAVVALRRTEEAILSGLTAQERTLLAGLLSKLRTDIQITNRSVGGQE